MVFRAQHRYDLVHGLTHKDNSGHSRTGRGFGIAKDRILAGDADRSSSGSSAEFSRNWPEAADDLALLDNDRDPLSDKDGHAHMLGRSG
jgi:hypothetical protein